MGYPVKVQKVQRPTNRSFYINFPVAVAEAIGLEKGERCEWIVQDRTTLILKRQPRKRIKLRLKTPTR